MARLAEYFFSKQRNTIMLYCFIIALLLLLAAVVTALTISRKKHRKKGVIKPTHVLLGGTFLSAVALFLPACYEMHRGDFFLIRLEKSVGMSIYHALRLFLAEADIDVIQEGVVGLTEPLSSLVTALAVALAVAAPLLTFDFLLSFFKNIASYRRYLKKFFRDAYVFSDLNEKSLALAESIAHKDPRAAIVFTDVFEQNEEMSFELVEQAKNLGAICFKKDVLSIRFGWHSKKRKLYFFTISMEDSENVNQSFALIKTFHDRKDTMLYVFSTSIDGELVLTSSDKGMVKVRRIKDVRSLIYRTLYDMEEAAIANQEDGQPPRASDLFAHAKPMEDGVRQIGAVVVGCGQHGMEMIKALCWFCQMDGYRIRIDALDQNTKKESAFTALCPELMSPSYNGVYVEGEAQYRIDFHTGLDVESAEFAAKIKELTDTTYVFVCLGTDERNIKTAIHLRTLFEQIGIHPMIHAVVYNTDKVKALDDIRNFRGQSYDIHFVGDLNTFYSEKVIIDSELEQEALERHLKYGPEETFWAHGYNYRSSMASALHMKARIACGIPGADKAEEELTEEERKTIEALEHRRWNAYMRSEGYIYSGSPDAASRNDLGKMHHNLVCFDLLSEEDKRKDSRVGTK